MKSIRSALLALLLVGLMPLLGSLSITAPTVMFISAPDTAPATPSSYATYPHKLTAATTYVAFCARVLWLGGVSTVGNTAALQGIFAHGGVSNGITLYIPTTSPSGGVTQQMVFNLDGVAAVYKAGTSWRLPIGTWTTLIFQRDSTTWTCRIGGADQNPDHGQTSTPGAYGDHCSLGNDPNDTGLANFNGFISGFACFVGSGAVPLSAGNITSIESSFANALTLTPASGSLVQYTALTGSSSTDTKGGSDNYDLTYTGVIAMPAPASTGGIVVNPGTNGGSQ